MILEYITQVDRNLGPNKLEYLAVTDQCAAHMKNTTFLKKTKLMFCPPKFTTQLQLLDLGIIYAFMCNYRKQFISKTVAMIDGGLLQDALCMKLDISSPVHFIAEAWRLTTLPIKNCLEKCGCLVDTVCSNDDNIPTLTKDITAIVHSLLQCSFRTTEHVTMLWRFVESRVSIRCWTSSIMPEEELEQEEAAAAEVAEDKVTFLDTMKALGVAIQYMFQYDM